MRLRTLKWLTAAGLLPVMLACGGCALFPKKPKPIPVAPPASSQVVNAPTATPTKPPKMNPLQYLSPFTWASALGKMLPHKAKPPTAQTPQLIGTVKMVNKEDKFVLIDGASFSGATAGDALVCITNQKETANLRMSTLKNPPFLIADISSGNPMPGDKVYKP